MNTNRDASQYTKYKRAKTLAQHHKSTVRLIPGSYSDSTCNTYMNIVLG